MAAIGTFIERYPLPMYFALTFAISWSAILLVVGVVQEEVERS